MHPDRLLPHSKVFGDALEGLPFVFVLSDDKLLEFSQLAVNRGLDFPEQSLPFRRVTSFVLDLPSVDADLPGELSALRNSSISRFLPVLESSPTASLTLPTLYFLPHSRQKASCKASSDFHRPRRVRNASVRKSLVIV